MSRRFIILGIFLGFSLAAWPQEGGLDILDGETLWSEGGQVTVSETYHQKSGLYRGTERIHDPLDQAFRTGRTTFGFSYGVLPELTLSALVPHVYSERRFDDGSGRASESADGMGDVTLFGKYRLFKKDWHLGSFNWTAFLGGELPTGATNEHEEGTRLPPALQPGSGSWDGIAATAATYEIGRLKVNGVLLGELNGKGAQDFRSGDLFVAEMTVGYRVIVKKFPGPLMRLDLGNQSRHEGAESTGGQRLPNSGGDTFLLKPGIVFWPRPWWGMVLSGELPVYQDLEGEQLGLDYGVSLSASYRF